MLQRTCTALGLLLAPVAGIEISAITKCQNGRKDLVNETTKVFTVQVCNLFGATCYMNQVETPSSECGDKALMIPNQECALFPIYTYKDYDRSDASKLQVGGPGCVVSCSGTDCKFTGGCVSVQCSLGGDPVKYAGPAMTKSGSSSSRKSGITNTSAADTFQVNTFASLHDVSGSKTVLLARTGNHVGTFERGSSASGKVTYNFGKLPTIKGNNYGPKACPSSTTLVSASTASGEEMRMCGSTGKWVYFAAANLLMDKTMYGSYSGDSKVGVASTKLNMNTLPYLSGNSGYRSGAPMNHSRVVYLHDGSSSSTDVLMTSGTIKPNMSVEMAAQDYAGQWRFYTVVFYCDKYDRTDLTTCPEENRKMFYVADPNPKAAFATSNSSFNPEEEETNDDNKKGVANGAPVATPALLALACVMTATLARK
eukprot:TRINITY_DN717_c0_g2_i1.p1 TRINITY_DN717_c0_g2~~TRINITY_DN717_c0_g2_i1.p1  ORF type:complete len:425 (+),score=80.53 TRINITY_DN717_c0_g2_i1:63-1337(+)